MKHQWLAYVIVGLLSVGAGVAIAGLPNNVPVDATIVPPTTTVAPEPTIATTTTTTAPPETTEPDDTTPDTTEAAPDTTEPDSTDAADALVDRAAVTVVAANGADIAGTAGRMVTRLEGLGYADVQSRDGTQIVDFTTVYFVPGFEDAAARLAADLELAPEFIAPLTEAPQVLEQPADVELLVYVGVDRAN